MPTPKPRPATQRHEQGRSHLASLMNYWLRQSSLSLERLCCIADWGLGEQGFLIPSQVSHIRNCTLIRGAPAKALDGMAGANRAIWLWREQGEAAALRKLGPHSSWRIEAEWLDVAIWLPSERHQGQPLGFGELACLSAGWLKLSYLGTMALSPGEAEDLSSRLYDLLNALVEGDKPIDRIAKVLAAYPIEDPARQEGLRQLLLGGVWTREELEAEMLSLAVTVATLRGIPPASYGPVELHAELSGHRRRS